MKSSWLVLALFLSTSQAVRLADPLTAAETSKNPAFKAWKNKNDEIEEFKVKKSKNEFEWQTELRRQKR